MLHSIKYQSTQEHQDHILEPGMVFHNHQISTYSYYIMLHHIMLYYTMLHYIMSLLYFIPLPHIMIVIYLHSTQSRHMEGCPGPAKSFRRRAAGRVE